MLGEEDVEKWVVGRGHAGSNFIKCVMKVSKKKKQRAKGTQASLSGSTFCLWQPCPLLQGRGLLVLLCPGSELSRKLFSWCELPSSMPVQLWTRPCVMLASRVVFLCRPTSVCRDM